MEAKGGKQVEPPADWGRCRMGQSPPLKHYGISRAASPPKMDLKRDSILLFEISLDQPPPPPPANQVRNRCTNNMEYKQQSGY